jgi:hypothetical protein
VVTTIGGSLTARLLLEPAERRVLQACLPGGIGGGESPGVVDEQVLAGLQARQVISADRQVHRSVLAGIVALADPAAYVCRCSLRVRSSRGGRA